MTSVASTERESAERAGSVEIDEPALWRAWREAADEGARSSLIEHYVPLARRIAAQLFARRPDDVADFDDYLHYGTIGLMEAVDRYRPGGDAAFATFATYRIRGAILNGLEKVSERRDASAFRKRAQNDRIRSLRDAGTLPEEGDEDDAFRALVETTIGLAIGVILDEPVEAMPEPRTKGPGVYDQVAVRRLREELVQGIADLPERESAIVRAHYLEHVPFVEIAERLGVTKGRVSQLHGRALGLLRDGLRAGRAFDDYF